MQFRDTIIEALARLTLKRRHDNYIHRLRTLHQKLDIPRNYDQRGLTFHREATTLVSSSSGISGEVCLMTPTTKNKWLDMRAAAADAGITLLLACAFRDLEEQARLIQTQLARGAEMEQILTWIAAPGYSEHHTGRALDIGSRDCFPPSSEFANTAAFSWLTKNAALFDFYLSYPEGNTQGIIFEPWHWLCRSKGEPQPAHCHPVSL